MRCQQHKFHLLRKRRSAISHERASDVAKIYPRFILCLQSTYTGVYANGGPTNVDGNGDLSELCDRTPADARGVKK